MQNKFDFRSFLGMTAVFVVTVASLVTFAQTTTAPVSVSGSAPQAPAQNVEVKIDVRAEDIDKTLSALGLSAKNAAGQDIYFFDTKDLSLFQHNLIFEAEQATNPAGASQFKVKVRPIDPAQISADWFRKKHFKCNADATTSSTKQQCSLKKKQKAADVAKVAQGKALIEGLFTDDQRRFAETYGVQDIPWTELEVLGPIAALTWQNSVQGLNFEVWSVGGQSFLEISKTVAVQDQATARDSILQLLQNVGAQVLAQGENKTEFVLQYFSQHP